MIRLVNQNNLALRPNMYRGLSLDGKPASAKNGDEFFEMDTGKNYMYSQEDDTWYEVSASGGGGGGGDNSGVMFVNLSWSFDTGYVADKSFSEIQTAIQSGILPVLNNEGTIAYYNFLSEDSYIDFRVIPTIDQQTKQCTGGHYFIYADESIVSDTDIIWGA